MDEAVTRYAHELVEAIASAVAHDPKVDACRQRARAAGYEMRVTLEALVGFASRRPAARAQVLAAPPPRDVSPRRPYEISASDRRFQRTLRIGVDEAAEEVE